MSGDLFEREVLALLEARVVRCGSAKRLAEEIGISPQYLHDIRRGTRGLSEWVLDQLGLERVVTYRLKQEKVRPE